MEELRLYFEEKMATLCPQYRRQKYLVAVSGGVDSMVLLYLCGVLKVPVVAAHINYQLRGAESRADEALVRAFCLSHKISLLTYTFDLSDWASAGKSIEEKARIVRYACFCRALRAYRLSGLMTAHHRDDAIETVLMHLLRGTGLKGLRGIAEKIDGVLRPLLGLPKQALYDLARSRAIPFREDRSNEDDFYLRNFLRHRIIPEIEKKVPHFSVQMVRNIRYFQESYAIYQAYIAQLSQKLLRKDKDGYRLSVAQLQALPGRRTCWYELLQPFSLTAAQVPELEKLLSAASGKFLHTATHELIRYDKHLLIYEKGRTYAEKVYVIEQAPYQDSLLDGTFSALYKDREKVTTLITDDCTALIAAEAALFPLLLRPLRSGDYFYPLGLNKKKKINRFLIDKKVPIPERRRTYVLAEATGKILWLVGHRLDHRCSVQEGTRRVLEVRYIT